MVIDDHFTVRMVIRLPNHASRNRTPSIIQTDHRLGTYLIGPTRRVTLKQHVPYRVRVR